MTEKHLVLLPRDLIRMIGSEWPESEEHKVTVTLADGMKFFGRVVNSMELRHNGPDCETSEITNVERFEAQKTG